MTTAAVQWAQFGKTPGDAADYRILRRSVGPWVDRNYHDLVRRLLPSQGVSGPTNDLQRVAVGGVRGPSDAAARVALLITSRSDNVDFAGRPIHETVVFLVEESAIPAGAHGWAVLYEALSTVDLPPDQSQIIAQIEAEPASLIGQSELGADVLAAMLCSGPVQVVVDATAKSLRERLNLAGSAIAFLPAGAREHVSVCLTAQPTDARRYRLSFVERVTDRSVPAVTWQHLASGATLETGHPARRLLELWRDLARRYGSQELHREMAERWESQPLTVDQVENDLVAFGHPFITARSAGEGRADVRQVRSLLRSGDRRRLSPEELAALYAILIRHGTRTDVELLGTDWTQTQAEALANAAAARLASVDGADVVTPLIQAAGSVGKDSFMASIIGLLSTPAHVPALIRGLEAAPEEWPQAAAVIAESLPIVQCMTRSAVADRTLERLDPWLASLSRSPVVPVGVYASTMESARQVSDLDLAEIDRAHAIGDDADLDLISVALETHGKQVDVHTLLNHVANHASDWSANERVTLAQRLLALAAMPGVRKADRVKADLAAALCDLPTWLTGGTSVNGDDYLSTLETLGSAHVPPATASAISACLSTTVRTLTSAEPNRADQLLGALHWLNGRDPEVLDDDSEQRIVSLLLGAAPHLESSAALRYWQALVEDEPKRARDAAADALKRAVAAEPSRGSTDRLIGAIARCREVGGLRINWKSAMAPLVTAGAINSADDLVGRLLVDLRRTGLLARSTSESDLTESLRRDVRSGMPPPLAPPRSPSRAEDSNSDRHPNAKPGYAPRSSRKRNGPGMGTAGLLLVLLLLGCLTGAIVWLTGSDQPAGADSPAPQPTTITTQLRRSPVSPTSPTQCASTETPCPPRGAGR